jgi:hypothetical protein
MKDVFEAARQSFFSGANGDAAASPSHTFTQVKTYDGPVVERGAALKNSAASGKTELVPCR